MYTELQELAAAARKLHLTRVSLSFHEEVYQALCECGPETCDTGVSVKNADFLVFEHVTAVIEGVTMRMERPPKTCSIESVKRETV